MRTTVDRLLDLKERGMRLMAHCGATNCSHARELDLDSLMERYGTHYVFINDKRISRKIKCGRCGHVGGTLTVVANTTARPRTYFT